MSPRTGRPKAENPKNGFVGVRLDAETIRKLDEVATETESTRSEIIRQGIEMVYEENKKENP